MRTITSLKSIFVLISLSIASLTLQAVNDNDTVRMKIPQEVRDKIISLVKRSNYHFPENIDSSRYYALEARSLAEKYNDSIGLGLTNYMFAKHSTLFDRLKEAMSFDLQALDLLSGYESDSLKADILMRLGRLNAVHSNYLSAMNYLFQSLHIAEDEGYEALIFEIYTWMALIYEDVGNDEGAYKYFKKALEVTDLIGKEEKSSELLMNLAGLHSALNDYENAEQYYFLALDAMSNIKDSAWHAGILLKLGDINLEQGKYENAANYYNSSLQIAKKMVQSKMALGNYYTARIYTRLAWEFKRNGEDNDAVSYLLKAINLAKSKRFSRIYTDASKDLSEVYEAMGQTDSSYFYFKQYYSKKDSLLNILQLTEIKSLELEYVYFRDLEANQMKRLQMELAYNKKINNYQLLSISGSLFSVILILIFIIFRNRQKNRLKRQNILKEKLVIEKKGLQKEIDVKNRELTSSIMFLLKKNNFLQSLAEDIKDTVNINKHNNIKGYLDILKRINESLSKDSWEEFEVRFNNVHQTFNENLLKDFPDLTPNELKLCAFLKLNMTSKDIETITYQSNNTITVARHRLRTKLGLDRDENLVTFLSKY